jgi:hypothetical protein
MEVLAYAAGAPDYRLHSRKQGGVLLADSMLLKHGTVTEIVCG